MLRRHFISTLGAGLGATCTLPLFAGRSSATGQRKAGLKKLVVIFQRGGNDAVNTLAPVGDAEQARLYREFRPTLNLPAGALLSLNSSAFFGFHPSFAPVADLINDGRAAFVHAVGYPAMNTSHFVAQSFLETAEPGNRRGSGWLNRFFAADPQQRAFRAVMVASNVAQTMAGPYTVPVSTNFGLLNMPLPASLRVDERAAYAQALRTLANDAHDHDVSVLTSTTHSLLDMFDRFQDRNAATYQPANGAEYPDTNLGNNLKHAVQMLKDEPSELNIEAVMVNHDGYDHHAGQIAAESPTQGVHADMLYELCQSIKALYQDMGPSAIDDVAVLVISEFGRTLRQNGSLGTDHGHASLAMVFGGTATGRVLNGGGDWPGLVGNHLAWRTDYRDIYWELLRNHLGASTAEITAAIPNHPYTPLGLLG